MSCLPLRLGFERRIIHNTITPKRYYADKSVTPSSPSPHSFSPNRKLVFRAGGHGSKRNFRRHFSVVQSHKNCLFNTAKRAKKEEAIIMKYPAYTVSQRLSAKEARKIVEALENGTTISNAESRATVQRILRRKNLISHSKLNANGTPTPTLPSAPQADGRGG